MDDSPSINAAVAAAEAKGELLAEVVVTSEIVETPAEPVEQEQPPAP